MNDRESNMTNLSNFYVGEEWNTCKTIAARLISMVYPMCMILWFLLVVKETRMNILYPKLQFYLYIIDMPSSYIIQCMLV